MAVTYADIRQDFDDSLGYIVNDVEALCRGHERVNYTVMLLVGCACEALADAGAFASKEIAFAELLPDDDWRGLSRHLFDALRNGLAHSFDTKHIQVDGQSIQIHMSWDMERVITIDSNGGNDKLLIGPRPLGARVCDSIREFRAKLQRDDIACQRFRDALDRARIVKVSASLWQKLKQKP
jgi:hypothetical protein